MNQEDFNNAFILLFSGAAELKGKEIKWKDKYGSNIYIEFPDLTPVRAITRIYYRNKNLWQECNWVKGVKYGRELRGYENGKPSYECNWAKGLRHGKELTWDKNGKLYQECNWVKGLRYGKELFWYKNGKIKLEYKWVNGVLIK